MQAELDVSVAEVITATISNVDAMWSLLNYDRRLAATSSASFYSIPAPEVRTSTLRASYDDVAGTTRMPLMPNDSSVGVVGDVGTKGDEPLSTLQLIT